MKNWIIHVGLPKCGSTWLQMRLFPALPEVDFVGKLYGKSPWNDFARQLTDLPGLLYPAERLRDWVRQEENALRRSHQLLSWEDFFGMPLKPGDDSQRAADRLHRLFPGARILMIVRRQPSLVESLYKQYVQIGGTADVEAFLQRRTPWHGIDLDALHFDRLPRYYRELFGEDRVSVLPFEMLTQNQQTFADAVCKVIGCAPVVLSAEEKGYVRTGYSPRFCGVARRLNFLTRSAFNPVGFLRRPSARQAPGWRSPFHLGRRFADALDRFRPAPALLSPAWRRRLTDRYAASNAALVGMFPALADFGYAPANVAETPSLSQ